MIQFFSSSPVAFYPQEHEENFSSLLKNVIRISNLLFVLVYLVETYKENIENIFNTRIRNFLIFKIQAILDTLQVWYANEMI